MIKGLTIQLAILLIAGHLLTELSEVLEHLHPSLKSVYIHPFISQSYKFPYPEGINILWWIYYCTNDFLWIITFFVAAVISSHYSDRLFRICAIFFVYHIIDHFMLWYNYKTGHGMYWIAAAAYVSASLMMFTKDKMTAPVRHIG